MSGSEPRRTRGHIAWESVDARLRSLREIWVASTAPSGRPDVTPVWFWWDGDSVFFTCASASRKVRNIAHQSEVVVCNGDGADPIILKGRAERVLEAEELRRLDRAYAEKYVDPGSGERATVFIAGDHAYRVRPRLVAAWMYAAVANRTEWRYD